MAIINRIKERIKKKIGEFYDYNSDEQLGFHLVNLKKYIGIKFPIYELNKII